MAGGRAPIIEVVIRDEVSRALELQKQKMRADMARVTFGPLEAGFRSLERAAQSLRREFSSLIGLTGLGALLGGGFVAGIAKATQAISDLGRASANLKYTAEGVGLTAKQLDMLAARGQARGLTIEQARGGVAKLAATIRELVLFGPKAPKFAEVFASPGGPQFLAEIRRAAEGPGGMKAAIELWFERMGQMPHMDTVKYLSELSGLGSIAWKDAMKIKKGDLPESIQQSDEEILKLNLELLKLKISFENIKMTVSLAVMPAMTTLIGALDKMVQGPIGEMIKDFGEWLKNLNIDWDKVVQGIKDVIAELGNFVDKLDPIVKQMGGWTIIIGGLVGIMGLGLLSSRLSGIAAGLTMIGNVAWVVPLLGMAVLSSQARSQAGEPTEGAMPGQPGIGKRLDRPPPTAAPPAPAPAPDAAPYGRDRRGRPYPAPQSQSSLDSFDPETAAPYRVAGGWQPPPRSSYDKVDSDTSALREQVREVKTQVAALGGFVSQLGLTDVSGAGGIAALAGGLRDRRGPAPGGGGGGGGGPRPTPSGPRRAPSGPRRAPTTTTTTTQQPRTTVPTTTDEEFRVKGGRMPTPEELADTSRPAGDRKNNPFNMWHDKWAAQQGGVPGNRTSAYDVGAVFPSKQAGAAAAIRKMLDSELYGGRRGGATIEQIIQTWVDPTGRRRGYGVEAAKAAGVPPTTMLTREFLLSDAGLRWLQYISRLETKWQAGYPLTDDEMKVARDAALRIKRPGSQTDPPTQQPNTVVDPKVPGADPQPNKSETGDEKSRVQQSQLGQRGIKYRYNPIDARLEAILDESAIAAGVAKVNIESGGQGHIHKGSPRHNIDPRTGGGLAADFDLFDERGNLIGRRDPRYLKFLEEIVARGAGGTGVGYMGGARIHAGLTGAAGIIGRGLSLYSGGTRAEIEAYNRGLRRYYADKPELAAILQRTLERRGGEKKRQQEAQREFDEYLRKQQEKDDKEQMPLTSRTRAGIKLNINLRGPRGVKATAASSGAVGSPTINREMDPTGGGRIESPA